MELLYGVTLLLTAVSVSSQEKLPPGGCAEGGELVAEGSLVPQQDPCHVCHCHRGRIQCFWKSCAPPPRLCEVMQLEDRCNPSLYVCPIPASVADAPIHSSSSLLTEIRRPAPETPPPQVTAPARGRGRSRSRFSSSRLRTERLRSPNSAAAPAAADKPARLPSRRRRPTARPEQLRQTVTRTQVRTPQTVTRTEVTPPQPATRSQFRSRRPTQRQVQSRPGMKIRLGPPVLPLIRPEDSFVPPPAEFSAAADTAVAASVLSGSTYFNEELSVPQNFTMPQGRGEAPLRSPQELLTAAEERKPFRFGPSRPPASSEPGPEVTETSEARLATEPPQPTTTDETPTEAPTTADTPARRPAGTARGFRRTGRRRESRRRLTPETTRSQTSSRRVVSPPRAPASRRSRLIARKQQVASPRAAATTETPESTAAPTAQPAPTAAPAAAALPAQTPSRRAHSRARGRAAHAAVPLMTFDYDLEEDIDPSDYMFPEFGRRLRRSLPAEEAFDAAAVRRLEEEWSLRQRRRRRSLLPGDENHVHSHEQTKSCSILGVKYELGEVIGVASDNCLECRCAAQAMFCSPKCCFFSLEERVLREGRRSSPEQEPPRPHPLHAYIVE